MGMIAPKRIFNEERAVLAALPIQPVTVSLPAAEEGPAAVRSQPRTRVVASLLKTLKSMLKVKS